MKSCTAFSMLVATLCLLEAQPVQAAPMSNFDLDSLAYMSSEVVEGEVVATADVNFQQVLTVKIAHSYAGTKKPGDIVTIGLGAVKKLKPGANVDSGPLEVGDKCFFFLTPFPPDRKPKDYDYWLAGSGLKLIVGDKVTGLVQYGNPGPYLNLIDDGDLAACRKKIADAVQWAAAFKTDLAAKNNDKEWLLSLLKERSAAFKNPPPGRSQRDAIGDELCRAIAATKDPDAIAEAGKFTESFQQKMVLGVAP